MSSPTIPLESDQVNNQPENNNICNDLAVNCESETHNRNPYDLQLNDGVEIENSRDFYFGDKNEFHGPLNIEESKQRESDIKTNNNNCNHNEKVPEKNKRGYIWLQNVPKYNSSLLGVSLGLLLLFIILLVTILCLKGKEGIKIEYKLQIIKREEWKGDLPTNETTPLVTPVPYIIIHHTATENCSTLEDCAMHVRAIQAFHVQSRDWYDIGYNFLVGGDGLVYEGRGWTKEGAHTFGWNAQSIGIAFIGTFIENPPSTNQLQTCQDLIKLGLDLNYIKEDYKLLGAKQFYATESPGTALMNEIKTWEHWAKQP